MRCSRYCRNGVYRRRSLAPLLRAVRLISFAVKLTLPFALGFFLQKFFIRGAFPGRLLDLLRVSLRWIRLTFSLASWASRWSASVPALGSVAAECEKAAIHTAALGMKLCIHKSSAVLRWLAGVCCKPDG